MFCGAIATNKSAGRRPQWTPLVRVAVVTPYLREDIGVLRRCHESVLAQSHPCTHIMVADGLPKSAVGTWQVSHIVLPQSHGDAGDAARLIGALPSLFWMQTTGTAQITSRAWLISTTERGQRSSARAEN
jgi:hypothetical protein